MSGMHTSNRTQSHGAAGSQPAAVWMVPCSTADGWSSPLPLPRSCACSSLNAAELLRVGGLPVVAALLSHCRSLLSASSSPALPSASILSSLLQATAVAVSLPAVRAFLAAHCRARAPHSNGVDGVPVSALPDEDSTVHDWGSCATMPADVVTSLELVLMPDAVQGALECILHMAWQPRLRAELLRAGALWQLLPLMLQFDASVEEGEEEGDGGDLAVEGKPGEGKAVDIGRQRASSIHLDGQPTAAAAFDASTALIPTEFGVEGPQATALGPPLQQTLGMPSLGTAASDSRGAGIGRNLQAVRNRLAALAARAVARLTGFDAAGRRGTEGGVEAGEEEGDGSSVDGEETAADSAAAHSAIQTLLTPRLAAQLGSPSPLPLLHTLAGSAATPQVIWRPAMRSQLLQYVEQQRAQSTGDGSYAVSSCDDFTFTALDNELQV